MAVDRNIVEQQRPELQKVRSLLLDPLAPKILDFDETVARTSLLQRGAVEGAFQTIGIDVTITPEYGATHLRGKTGREIMETVLRKRTGGANEGVVDTLVQARNRVIVDIMHEQEHVSELFMPGVSDLVRLLRATQQKVAIATQSPEALARVFIEKAKVDGRPIADVFDPKLIVGSDVITRAEERFSTNHRRISLGKPHINSVLHGAHRVTRDYKRALYIGDSDVDARTVAGRENITGVIVNSNPAKREKLRREFGHYPNLIIINSLEELTYE